MTNVLKFLVQNKCIGIQYQPVRSYVVRVLFILEVVKRGSFLTNGIYEKEKKYSGINYGLTDFFGTTSSKIALRDKN